MMSRNMHAHPCAVESEPATIDSREHIRRCGTVDAEFFNWLSEQPEPMDQDDAGAAE